MTEIERVNAIVRQKVYEISKKEGELMDSYLRLHIKERPKYLPEFLYRKILKTVLYLTMFKKA